MKRNLAYLRYVLRHKWFVFLEAWNLGIPWLGLTHDLSKFLPREWSPYAHTFFAADGSYQPRLRDKTGYYDPALVSLDFRQAWLHHQRNKHHWQAWCVIGDGGSISVIDIPLKYRKEMLADWRGAARVHGTRGAAQWYWPNRDKLGLHENTRAWLEMTIQLETEDTNA